MIYIASATPPAMQPYVVQLQRGVDNVPGLSGRRSTAAETHEQDAVIFYDCITAI
jgi:hypothetical protein